MALRPIFVSFGCFLLFFSDGLCGGSFGFFCLKEEGKAWPTLLLVDAVHDQSGGRREEGGRRIEHRLLFLLSSL